jgi:LemA protein
MPVLLILALAAVAIGLIVVVALYNGLVGARARVRESSSTIDTELKRRHDLIPNLVETVKGYMSHERELLQRLVQLREQAEQVRPGAITSEQVRVEGELQNALSGLRARFEAYPELKASSNFQALQGELANTEDRIQGALRFYNGNVRDLNVKCESFPSGMIASMFGFEKATFFELKDPAAREVPRVSFGAV